MDLAFWLNAERKSSAVKSEAETPCKTPSRWIIPATCPNLLASFSSCSVSSGLVVSYSTTLTSMFFSFHLRMNNDWKPVRTPPLDTNTNFFAPLVTKKLAICRPKSLRPPKIFKWKIKKKIVVNQQNCNLNKKFKHNSFARSILRYFFYTHLN